MENRVSDMGLHNIEQFVGRELGVSRWVTLDQPCIAEFARH